MLHPSSYLLDIVCQHGAGVPVFGCFVLGLAVGAGRAAFLAQDIILDEAFAGGFGTTAEGARHHFENSFIIRFTGPLSDSLRLWT